MYCCILCNESLERWYLSLLSTAISPYISIQAPVFARHYLQLRQIPTLSRKGIFIVDNGTRTLLYPLS